MFKPIKVVDIELSRPLSDIIGLDGYRAVKAILRVQGTPIGFLDLPVRGNVCTTSDIQQTLCETQATPLVNHFLRNGLHSQLAIDEFIIDNLLKLPAPEFTGPYPLVTVVVCTHNRTADLRQCLQALQQLDYPQLDILVVDNAPGDEATRELVEREFTAVRYLREDRPGLDWARNCAIHHAQGEIIAYTDDDVIVDANWVKALIQPFVADPSVMAVTGLVVPYELETEAQQLFEMYGGFSRGFKREWFRVNPLNGREWEYRGTGRFGTGANMAFRRTVFDHIGPFDPALDVGTATNGGGDLEMFFRVLKEGHTLVYEPAAMVRHRHRRDHAHLHTQITNNGIGLFAFWLRSAWVYREERRNLWRMAVWWVMWWYLRRLILSYLRPSRFPRSLIWTEIGGMFQSLRRYQQARKTAVTIAQKSGIVLPNKPLRPPTQSIGERKGGTAVRLIDITQPLLPITDISDYAAVRLFVTHQGAPIGQVDILNCFKPISVPHLCDTLVNELGAKLWAPMTDENRRYIQLHHALLKRFEVVANEVSLPEKTAVSIILATFDRPHDLAACLPRLLAQNSRCEVEIIVVDNHPSSGLTPPIIAQFPQVTLISEPRQGLAYARNAGIRASKGDIIVMTDDDVIVPPDWLEKLIAPFSNQEVMAVTGNVLPAELETGSQLMFEAYGGLGRGYARIEADERWFEKFRIRAVPTWTLGATANAAFRATIFQHPNIGLMEEALGPGLPSGVGEDTYLFYKILKAGYTIMYEPGAYLQHIHRRTEKALRRQLYNYSKGHVAYHLTTLFQDGDVRALFQLGFWVPFGIVWRAFRHVSGREYYPLRYLALEAVGNLVGPFALLRSRWRVYRQRQQGDGAIVNQETNRLQDHFA